jgi:hypothetical protein
MKLKDNVAEEAIFGIDWCTFFVVEVKTCFIFIAVNGDEY